jgi:hypothetical protein
VQNGHGSFDIRNNILWGNGDKGTQDVFIRFDISGTWRPHAGPIYKRNHVRWTPSLVSQDDHKVLVSGKGPDELKAGEWYYDAALQTLYVHKTDGSAPKSAHCLPAEAWTLDHNVYSTDPRVARIRYDKPGAGGRVYMSLAAFRAEVRQEEHGMEVDPRYAAPDAEPPDFRLRTDSPVLGAGADLGEKSSSGTRPGREPRISPGAFQELAAPAPADGRE